jgi:thiopurine S-methyltransferase
MEKDFWLERWEREEIGFHQNEVNPYLRQYWQELHLARDSVVFVPLCGLRRPWGFYENGVGVACRNVRFT